MILTVGIVVREREIVAEPFLLIGLIAVVRRILLVTAEAEQTIGTQKFLNLVLELGVLTALVIALSGAFYFTRSSRASPQYGKPGHPGPRIRLASVNSRRVGPVTQWQSREFLISRVEGDIPLLCPFHSSITG